jgi:transposase
VNVTSSSPLSESEQVTELKRELQWAHLKIQLLEEKLRLERIKKYGPGSEKLSDAQLELLELEPGVSNVEVQAESEREALPAPEKKKRKHPGRQQLPAGLPRVEQVIACAPEQCTCQACGEPMAVIGYDQSEQLDVEPARYFVLVTKREKRACKCCQQGGVAAAAPPARIIDKSLVSDRVVIDTVVGKYSDHLPLYRQSAILEREAGLEISRATLDGWVMRVGELLTPLAAAMRRELVGGSYMQADETPWMCRCTMGEGRTIRRISGSMANREAVWCSTSVLGADAMGRRSFWGSSKGFCRPTAISPTSMWAGQRWCMRPVGRMRAEASLTR